jgi:hypothetical protein
MHASQSEASQVTPSGSWVSVTMSASASRPPGRRARAAAANTAGLSGERLITPLEITQSIVPSSTGGVHVAGAELDVGQAVLACQVIGFGELRVGHVDADHATIGARRAGGEEAVCSRAAAEVEQRLPCRDRSEVEEVADAGERVDRRRGDAVEVG